MILSIALTQFVFISLGILSVNVLLKAAGFAANVAHTFPPFPVWMATQSLWLFALPLAWIACAGLCLHIIKGSLAEKVARFTGILLAVAIFAAYFTAGFMLL